jgi:homoserine kinase
MPGIYQHGEYDAGGAAIGAIKHNTTILPDTAAMEDGDVLLGLASSGVHSNGFSLVRRIVEKNGISYTDPCPWDSSQDLGTAFLEPTKIYVKPLLACTKRGLIKGMAHITGGGLLENIPRMLPKTLAAELDAKTWPLLDVFKWLKGEGRMDNVEFARTFNTGLGMVCVVSPGNVNTTMDRLQEYGEKVYVVGSLKRRGDGEEECVVRNMDVWN